MTYLNIDEVIIASAFVDDGHTSPIVFLKKIVTLWNECKLSIKPGVISRGLKLTFVSSPIINK
jgi:hypothetical protein